MKDQICNRLCARLAYFSEELMNEINMLYNERGYLTREGVNHSSINPSSPEVAAVLSNVKRLVGTAEYSFSTDNDPHKKNPSGSGTEWDGFVSVAAY